jgi:hypothetical protein
MNSGRVSLALSVLALVVAIGGTGAYASGLVTSAQIKNGTIQLADMSSTAKQALKGQQGAAGAPGATGAQGLSGLTGLSGLPGLNGGFDPNKVIYVAGTPVTDPPGAVVSATAVCPQGTIVISGGAYTSIASVAGSESHGSPTTWYIIVDNNTSISVDVHAVALCAAP